MLAELVACRDGLNPANLARKIADLQTVLLRLAKDKNRSTLPRQHLHRTARRPQRHPNQSLLTPS